MVKEIIANRTKAKLITPHTNIIVLKYAHNFPIIYPVHNDAGQWEAKGFFADPLHPLVMY
jgi:hypothetical protein